MLFYLKNVLINYIVSKSIRKDTGKRIIYLSFYNNTENKQVQSIFLNYWASKLLYILTFDLINSLSIYVLTKKRFLNCLANNITIKYVFISPFYVFHQPNMVLRSFDTYLCCLQCQLATCAIADTTRAHRIKSSGHINKFTLRC